MKNKLLSSLLAISSLGLILAGCDNNEPEKNGGGEDKKPVCNHIFDDWEVENNPSYEGTGKATRVCSECDEVEEMVLPVLSDSKYTLGRNTATCTDGGTLSVSYPIGEKNLEFRVDTDPKGHSYTFHEATELSPSVLVGHEAYYSCQNCEALFNDKKERIESLDDILISFYHMDEESHWSDENPTHLPHTFSEYVVDKQPSYFEKGLRHKECSFCGYVLNEEIPMTSIGVVSSDGTYESKNYKDGLNEYGANKICDGIYVFGSEAKSIKLDNNNNFVFGGQANLDGRIMLVDIAGPATFTIKGGASKSNTSTTFGFFDGAPNADADNFLGTPCSSSSTSNADYVFKLEKAGRYWFGCADQCSMKIKSINVELHEINMNEWHYDANQHFHSSNDSSCLNKLDAGDHTFGAWEPFDDTQDVKTCSVCEYKIYEDKESHAGCQHTYVAGPSQTEGKIKYTCSQCQESYEKNVVRFVPDSSGKTANMVVGYGNNFTDEEGEITSLSVYASPGNGSFEVGNMDAHEFTMSDTSKVSYSDTLIIGGKNYESCVLKMKIPAACLVRVYAYTELDPNFRLWNKTDTKDKSEVITDVKAAQTFHVLEFEATREDTYNIGSSAATSYLTYFAVEFIY